MTSIIIVVILIVTGVILILRAFDTHKDWQFFNGLSCIVVSIISLLILALTDCEYSYETSKYNVEITYQTIQKGDQIVCDTIYEFKKR